MATPACAPTAAGTSSTGESKNTRRASHRRYRATRLGSGGVNAGGFECFGSEPPLCAFAASLVVDDESDVLGRGRVGPVGTPPEMSPSDIRVRQF